MMTVSSRSVSSHLSDSPAYNVPSSGTRESHKRYVATPTIMILSPTFYGSATKSSSYPQGSYPPRMNCPLKTCAYFRPLFPTQSADGTLSVMDVRGKKLEPLARSEDQEDELLSVVAIRKQVPLPSVVLDLTYFLGLFSGTKVVVGTQVGILSIFNRNQGWGDCVDRVPGYVTAIKNLLDFFSSQPAQASPIC